MTWNRVFPCRRPGWDSPNAPPRSFGGGLGEVKALARDPLVVAIGETRLDYYRQSTPHDRHRDALHRHLDLAAELGRPVVIHNREADADMADALEAHSGAGVLHCFSSTDPRYLSRMLDAGYMVSFAGTLTYKSAADLRALAARVPLDRLLIETDCPYLAPVPHRGKRNEPAFVRATAACLAELVGLSLEDLADRVWRNMLRTFPAFAAMATA